MKREELLALDADYIGSRTIIIATVSLPERCVVEALFMDQELARRVTIRRISIGRISFGTGHRCNERVKGEVFTPLNHYAHAGEDVAVEVENHSGAQLRFSATLQVLVPKDQKKSVLDRCLRDPPYTNSQPEKVTVCVDCLCEHYCLGNPRCDLCRSVYDRSVAEKERIAKEVNAEKWREADEARAAARAHPHHHAELWREADRLVAAIERSRRPGRQRVAAKLAIVRDALRAGSDDGVISTRTAGVRSARNDNACAAVALGHMFLAGQIDCDVAVRGLEYELMEWQL